VVTEIKKMPTYRNIGSQITFCGDMWLIIAHCAGIVQNTDMAEQYVHLNPIPVRECAREVICRGKAYMLNRL
jgi:hypothetical protein